MVSTGQQPLGVGVMVQEEKKKGALQQGRRRSSFGGGGGGGSQERDLGTPPLSVKPPRPGVFGDDDLVGSNGSNGLGGGDGGVNGGGGTLASHDSDVELDRLWDRFNSLKGELPATSNTPPPTEHTSSNGTSGSESGTRRSGGVGNEGTARKASGEELEAWAHRREIAGKLEDIQRALAAKAEDGRRRQDELEGLYHTIEELETYVELEASKRLEAECRAQNLEAGLQVLADRCDLEIAARETAESAAKRYMDLIAEARAAWQKTQDIVQNKERELAAAESRVERESGGDDLQRRLEDARKEKELERQHSASLKLALEGGALPSPGAAAAAAAAAAATAGASPKVGRRRTVGSLVDVRGDDSERRPAGTADTSSGSHHPRLSLDPSRVAAAEARLQAAIDEAAAAATATAGTPNEKTKEASPSLPPQQQKVEAKQSHAPRRRQRQQREQRRDPQKVAPRPRIVPLTKDRPELGGGDIYRSLGGSYGVTPTTSINDSGGGGAPCTYSGTALNHDRWPAEASFVDDYFSVGDDERSSVGVDESYSESRPHRGRGLEKDKESNRPLGVCRETMVKLKGTVGSAVVKAMNDGGKNMKVHDSKVRPSSMAAVFFCCFLLCRLCSREREVQRGQAEDWWPRDPQATRVKFAYVLKFGGVLYFRRALEVCPFFQKVPWARA